VAILASEFWGRENSGARWGARTEDGVNAGAIVARDVKARGGRRGGKPGLRRRRHACGGSRGLERGGGDGEEKTGNG